MFRVLSLSKFRSWLIEDFSSNKAAGSLQPLHTETETGLYREPSQLQKSGKSKENKTRGRGGALQKGDTDLERQTAQGRLFCLQTTPHHLNFFLLSTCRDLTMAEEAEVEVDPSSTSRSEQHAPHFLRDVIFHGKFKVSVSTRDEQSTQER